MKEWIKELCPEIADWQAELIAQHAQPQRELNCVCGAVWEGDEMVCMPHKRQWVGLTDKEIKEVATKSQDGISPHDDTLRFANAIEAKLKDKNGG